MTTLQELLAPRLPERGEKRLPGYAYKLQESNYAMDVQFTPSSADIDESAMSVTIPFASGLRRDGVGDLLEIGGIDTTRHRKNPIVLFDHGKKYELPVAQAEDPDTGEYTVFLDPEGKVAKVKAFFYQGNKSLGGGGHYDHAVFCEQLFDLMVKKFIRAGSIGYQVLQADPLQADYQRGIPQGMHLLRVLMLEASAVVLPANMDTTRKELAREVLSMKRLCGRPLSPILVKSLSGYSKAIPEGTSQPRLQTGQSKRRHKLAQTTMGISQAADNEEFFYLEPGTKRQISAGGTDQAHIDRVRAENDEKALRRQNEYDEDDPRNRGPVSRGTSSKTGSSPVHKKSMKSLRQKYGKSASPRVQRVVADLKEDADSINNARVRNGNRRPNLGIDNVENHAHPAERIDQWDPSVEHEDEKALPRTDRRFERGGQRGLRRSYDPPKPKTVRLDADVRRDSAGNPIHEQGPELGPTGPADPYTDPYGEKKLKKYARRAGAADRNHVFPSAAGRHYAHKYRDSTRRDEEVYRDKQGRSQAYDAAGAAYKGPRQRRKGKPAPNLNPKGHHSHMKDPEYAAVHAAAQSGDKVAAMARRDRAMELGGKNLSEKTRIDPTTPEMYEREKEKLRARAMDRRINGAIAAKKKDVPQIAPPNEAGKGMKSLRQKYKSVQSGPHKGKDSQVAVRAVIADAEEVVRKNEVRDRVTEKDSGSERLKKRQSQAGRAIAGRVIRNEGVDDPRQRRRNLSRKIPRNDGKSMGEVGEKAGLRKKARAAAALVRGRDTKFGNKRPSANAVAHAENRFGNALGDSYNRQYSKPGGAYNSTGSRGANEASQTASDVHRSPRQKRKEVRKHRDAEPMIPKGHHSHMKDPEYAAVHAAAQSGDRTAAYARQDWAKENAGKALIAENVKQAKALAEAAANLNKLLETLQ